MLPKHVLVALGGLLAGASNRELNGNVRCFLLSCGRRIGTLDNWWNIVAGTLAGPPDCSEAEGNCGSPGAIPFFITFIIVLALVLCNLFVSVVVDSFERTQGRISWRLNAWQLDAFVDGWSALQDEERAQIYVPCFSVREPAGMLFWHMLPFCSLKLLILAACRHSCPATFYKRFLCDLRCYITNSTHSISSDSNA